MIRDPSDGTVRVPVIKPVMDAGTSGLATDRLKTDELARLKQSRDWLREYFKPVQSTSEVAEPPLRSPEQGE